MLHHLYSSLTKEFTTPTCVKNVNSPYTLQMVSTVLNAMSDQPGQRLTSHCRVYLDGRRAGPFEAKRFIKNAAKLGVDDEAGWSRVADHKPFLIFINYAALYSGQMFDATRALLGDFLNIFEPDGVSLEHHIIIGHYHETDFGVHVDDAPDRVVHFNLGPNEKEMLLWPRLDFIAEYGPNPTRALDDANVDDATAFPMPAGSSFFLPADFYHVGRSPKGMSVVVALAFSRQTNELQLASVMSEISKAVLPVEDATPYWSNFSHAPSEEQQTQTDALFSQKSYSNWLEHARARSRSNHWMAEIRPLGAPRFPQGDFAIGLGRERPEFIDEPGVLHLYARGNHIKLTSPDAIQWVSHLRHGGTHRLTSEAVVHGVKRRDPVFLVVAWLVATQTAQVDEIVLTEAHTE